MIPAKSQGNCTMSHSTVLQSGLIGYLYRWLRNGGVVAIATGLYLIGPLAYHAIQDGRAGAEVVRIEIECVVAERTWFAPPTKCYPDAITAQTAHDVAFAVLAFKSEIGAEYVARLKIEDLHRRNLQRGDTVGITYARDNPNFISAVPTLASFAKGGWLIASGLLMLAVALLARRAVNYRGDLDAEIAELARAAAGRSAGVSPKRRPREV
jgi:hypothetical protein